MADAILLEAALKEPPEASAQTRDQRARMFKWYASRQSRHRKANSSSIAYLCDLVPLNGATTNSLFDILEDWSDQLKPFEKELEDLAL